MAAQRELAIHDEDPEPVLIGPSVANSRIGDGIERSQNGPYQLPSKGPPKSELSTSWSASNNFSENFRFAGIAPYPTFILSFRQSPATVATLRGPRQRERRGKWSAISR